MHLQSAGLKNGTRTRMRIMRDKIILDFVAFTMVKYCHTSGFLCEQGLRVLSCIWRKA